MQNEFNTKELGLFITPYNTAEYIVSKLEEINKNIKILDPCVGPGIFVKILLKHGVMKEQIHTFDLNPNYENEIKSLGVHFKQQDTLLSITRNDYNQFDFIVGNPPYLSKASTYIRINRTNLKKIYGRINAHETYSMFLVNGIWRLKEGGKLGFITSDSFLTLSTHTRLRKFILDNCIINEILLAPKNLFLSQGVSTSPAILILTKCSGEFNKKKRENNTMRIISRINSEEEYRDPGFVHEIKQSKYHSLPFNIFFIDIEEQIIKLFEKSEKLKHYLKGYIGMHTHNNKKFIAAIEGTELAKLFKKRNEKITNEKEKFKIISNEEFNSKTWKPYLKRGGGDQYYRPIMEALKWDKDSIQIYDIPRNAPFEHEGIAISGVSSRLAARYMPKGCYWDSNKVIGFIVKNLKISINYVLGLLNSSLYNYLAKGIINNTSSIQISGIYNLPIILPDEETKIRIERLVKIIIDKQKREIKYNFSKEQRQIDNIIYEFYDKTMHFPETVKEKIDNHYSTNK